MNRIIRTTVVFTLVLVLGLTAAPTEVSASVIDVEDGDSGSLGTVTHGFEREYLGTKKITQKTVASHERTLLIHNGKTLASDARIINGEIYVAVRSFIGELGGMSVVYNSSTRTLYVSGSGLNMEIIDGGNVIYANGRTIYGISPSVIMTNGRMYSPLSSLAKILGLTQKSGEEAILSGKVTPLRSGAEFYDADAVYWLSRIISAESKGEPLLGQIAVGNIVLNRTRSPLYPNTIWGVIFDRKYGVQFSPILNGTIYNTPSAVSVTAAKICLEGYSVSDEALFFLQPRLSTSSWIPKNREYLFTIGNHDFYA